MVDVTWSLEDMVGVWAMPPIVASVRKCLKGTAYDVFNCEHAIDVIMIRYFCLILDGRMLTLEDRNIDSWECFLTGFSGKMKQCQGCENLESCLEPHPDPMETGPNYKKKVILLHSEKRERDVEGLIAQVPPMAVDDIFSMELEQWLLRTIEAFHRKALLWRIEYEKWAMRHDFSRGQDPRTAEEIAEDRWFNRNDTLSMKFPDYD